MIDFATEQLVTFNEAAKLLPKRGGGKKIHVSTVYRWTQCGVKGVVLEALKVGGTWCTSLEALQRFFERVTVVSQGLPPPPPPMSPARRRHLAWVDKRLKEELGL